MHYKATPFISWTAHRYFLGCKSLFCCGGKVWFFPLSLLRRHPLNLKINTNVGCLAPSLLYPPPVATCQTAKKISFSFTMINCSKKAGKVASQLSHQGPTINIVHSPFNHRPKEQTTSEIGEQKT